MFNRLKIPEPSLWKLQDLKLLRNNLLDFPKRLRNILCFGISKQICYNGCLEFTSYWAIDISQEQMFFLFAIFIRIRYDAIDFMVRVLIRDRLKSGDSDED